MLIYSLFATLLLYYTETETYSLRTWSRRHGGVTVASGMTGSGAKEGVKGQGHNGNYDMLTLRIIKNFSKRYESEATTHKLNYLLISRLTKALNSMRNINPSAKENNCSLGTRWKLVVTVVNSAKNKLPLSRKSAILSFREVKYF